MNARTRQSMHAPFEPSRPRSARHLAQGPRSRSIGKGERARSDHRRWWYRRPSSVLALAIVLTFFFALKFRSGPQFCIAIRCTFMAASAASPSRCIVRSRRYIVISPCNVDSLPTDASPPRRKSRDSTVWTSCAPISAASDRTVRPRYRTGRIRPDR